MGSEMCIRDRRNIVLMRPCNNMIEFKQIIGRGTRMYDGKDFFTVYDFVKAHQNFADPEWDGEPTIEEPPEPRPDPLGSDESDGELGGDPTIIIDPPPRPEKIKITLSDGKVRSIRHVSATMYWSSEGAPITANEFMQRMFDDLPRFFENEEQLRELWSDPNTREKLMIDLAEAGYDDEKLDSIKALIDAQDSDVYDVLAHVAYAAKTVTRQERAQGARPAIQQAYADYKQQEFINFILSKYVEDGVGELAANKMRSLIELKYNTISDAAAEFGSPAIIRETFMGFQKHLYERAQ